VIALPREAVCGILFPREQRKRCGDAMVHITGETDAVVACGRTRQGDVL
jgi:hypothetical protein